MDGALRHGPGEERRPETLLGGLGNPAGVFAAGLLIGISEAVTMAVTSPSWAPVVPFTLLIAILVLWPERV